MPSKCRACGEVAVVSGAESVDGSEVCTACGVVSESCSFQDGGPSEGTAFVAPTRGGDSAVFVARSGKSSSGAGVRRINARNNLRGNSKEGCNWVQRTAGHFNMDAHVKRRAEEMYVELVEKMGRTAPQRKTALAAACCYVVLRQDHWPVSLKAVSGFVQCTPSEVNVAIRFVQKVMGIQFSRASPEELLPSVLKNYRGDDSDRVLAGAKEVLKLAKACWLGDGYSPQNVSAAAAYIAWRASEPRRAAAATYADFCKAAGSPEGKSARDTAGTFAKALSRLAGKVPWLAGEKIGPRNVFRYVADVLKHKASLVLDVSEEDAATKKVEEAGRDKTVYDAFRPAPVASEPPRTEAAAAEECDSDFSDSEIDRYIRSPADVDAVKKHMSAHGFYDGDANDG